MDPFTGVLGVDIETSSAFDIKNGAWAYSQHPSTIVYCVCFGFKAGKISPTRCFDWVPGNKLPEPVVDYMVGGGTLIAHNASFEQSVWQNILTPFYEFPKTDPEQWRDTQILGLAANLPMTLDGLAKALGCPVQKDKEGAELMKAMCVPIGTDENGDYLYDRDPDNLIRLVEYCRDDVLATLDCYYRLPKLTMREEEIYRVDRRVNDRGMFLDQAFAARCSDITDRRKAELADEVFEFTAGELLNSTAPPALKTFLKTRGVVLPKVARVNSKGERTSSETCDKATVAKLLSDDKLHPECRTVLRNREEANKATSLAKLARVPLMAGTDGRLRNVLQYCGAHTGRWTSSGLQVHNLPKVKMSAVAMRLCRAMIMEGDLDGLKMVHDQPLVAISESLRSVISAEPGHELIAADFSAIEARVVAWLAGQDNIVGHFAKFDSGETDVDIYVYTANEIGSDNRSLGKVCCLALGYGMGALKFVGTAANWGVPVERKEAVRIHRMWRKANSDIVAFWHMLEAGAREAIQNPFKPVSVGKIAFGCTDHCLIMQLPSNRAIRYWTPKVVPVIKKFEVLEEDGTVVEKEIQSEEIRFRTMAKDKSGMEWESTYGGKLAENATQAVARDLLAEAMLRIDRVDPYEVVIHVHDSLGAEVPAGTGSVEEFCELMSVTPEWAEGCPVAADGYRDIRFRG